MPPDSPGQAVLKRLRRRQEEGLRAAAVEGSLARPGARAVDTHALRGIQRAMAERVVRLTAPMFGHGGRHKIVDGEAPYLVRSGASALRECAGLPPESAPYTALAADVQRHAGDQATTALLLAAGVVGRCLDGGAPVPALLDGLRLAARQTRGWIDAHAEPAEPVAVLRGVASLDPGLVLEGLRSLAEVASIDLDDVHITHGTAAQASWSDGLVLHPHVRHDVRRLPDAPVLLVREGMPALRQSVSYRLDAVRPGLATEEERTRHAQAVDHVTDTGIGLVVCRKKLPEAVADALTGRGVAVLEDCPGGAAKRIQACTGAAQAPELGSWQAEDLGSADLRRRPHRLGGWEVRGPGPSATLLLPRSQPMLGEADKDDAERLLRAAGLVLAQPEGLPGGGRWQRGLAASLRAAADHAPGKAPIGVRTVADALDALADDLVRNMGLDPLATPLPPDADGVLDPAPCVRLAVTAALETAVQVLRLDGRYDKRPSRGEDLRGGAGPSGSPKGMPGDIPPLM